jgi:Plasmid pRiA4b ORF-3-like protein
MNRDPQQSVTYQLRIVLRDFSPLIWRRLHVPSNIDLARLHRILQILFSWDGEHRHRFHIHGKDYGMASAGGIRFDNDPRQARLSDFHLHCRERFLYQYDFTACWELEIRLENILPFDPACSYPVCIGGKRAGPPEHCVGAWAYLEWRDQHVFHPPLEDLSLLADAVSRFLESGDRQSIGDLNELREAAERAEAYRQCRPDHFDRRRVNGQLRALSGQEWGRR